MKRTTTFFIELIDRFYFVEKKMFPKSVIKKIYHYISTVFEEEAIDCYLSDRQDIGFFESFILGSEESRRLFADTDSRMKEFKKADLIEKLSGYVPPAHIVKSQKEEVMQEYIMSKKNKVIETLKKKNEIIRYLGRRIVTRNEKMYQKLERLYNQLYNDVCEQITNSGEPPAGRS